MVVLSQSFFIYNVLLNFKSLNKWWCTFENQLIGLDYWLWCLYWHTSSDVRKIADERSSSSTTTKERTHQHQQKWKWESCELYVINCMNTQWIQTDIQRDKMVNIDVCSKREEMKKKRTLSQHARVSMLSEIAFVFSRRLHSRERTKKKTPVMKNRLEMEPANRATIHHHSQHSTAQPSI